MVMDGLSAQSVGREFVRQYYTMLHEAPKYLHRFYSHDSSFLHDGMVPPKPGHDQMPAVGQNEINRSIESLNFSDCHARIRQVDSQLSVSDSVVIQVVGELSNNGVPLRRFMQTFVLVPQSPKKFYVHNDIFRYQDEVFSEPVENNVQTSSYEGDQQKQHLLQQPAAETAAEVKVEESVDLGYQGDDESPNGNNSETTASEAEVDPQLVDKQQPPTTTQQPPTTTQQLPATITQQPPTTTTQLPTTTITQQPPTTTQQQPPTTQQPTTTQPTTTQPTTTQPTTITTTQPTTITQQPSTTPQQIRSSTQQKPTTQKVQQPSTQQQSNVQVEPAKIALPAAPTEKLSWAAMARKGVASKQVIKPAEGVARQPPNDLVTKQQQSAEQTKPEVVPKQQQQANHAVAKQQANHAVAKQQANHAVAKQQQQANHAIAKQQQQQQQQGGVEELLEGKPDEWGEMPSSQKPSRRSDTDEDASRAMQQYPDNQQVFIGNIPHNMPDQELHDFFAKFGTVLDIRINRKNNNNLPNFGFVLFESPEVVQSILSQRPLYNGKQRVNVEEKKRKDELSHPMSGRPRSSNPLPRGKFPAQRGPFKNTPPPRSNPPPTKQDVVKDNMR